MPETVAVIHRVLASGSSFPSVVETSAGRLYVMKLSGAGSGQAGACDGAIWRSSSPGTWG